MTEEQKTPLEGAEENSKANTPENSSESDTPKEEKTGIAESNATEAISETLNSETEASVKPTTNVGSNPDASEVEPEIKPEKKPEIEAPKDPEEAKPEVDVPQAPNKGDESKPEIEIPQITEDLAHIVDESTLLAAQIRVNPEAELTPEPEIVAETETTLQADSANDSDEEEISEEEGEDHDKELEEAEDEDISTHTREELVEMLTVLASNEEPISQRNKFNKTRRAFIELSKKAREEAFEAFIEAGGNKDEFEYSQDELDEKQRELNKKFRERIQKVRQDKEQEKITNLKLKEEVLEGLKGIIQNEADVMKAFDAVHEYQTKWRNIGNVPFAKAEHLWQSYRFYVSKFYDLIDLHKELRELDHKKNLEAKVHLCEIAEALIIEPSINKAIHTLRDVQEKWKDIGHVPKENNDEIWDRFKSAADRVYDKRREYLDEKKAVHEQNYREKLVLCEKVEAMITEVPTKHGEWQKQMDALLAEQETWKKIGRAPADKNDEIWKRFKGTFDTFFKARRAFFAEIRKEETRNLQIKTDLCVQAEAVMESSEWKETAELLKKLQETWKDTGHVNYKQSDALWKRFRKACDHFFSRRSENFADQEKEYDTNLELKIALIEKMEAHTYAADKSKDLDTLKAFQQEWLDIGRIPIKLKDKTYQRYKRALDKGYDQVRLSESEKAQMNLARKVERFKGNDGKPDSRERGSLKNRVDSLNTEIKQLENNIEFFGKGAEALRKPIERKIEAAKAELAALKDLMKKQN